MDYATSLRVRYRDRDPEGHVNNAVYATYFEEARRDYVRDVVGADLTDRRRALAALSVEFERRITAGPVRAGVSVAELGRTSIAMEYELRVAPADASPSVDATAERAAGWPLAATGRTTLVLLDEDRTPEPVPPEWRERITGDRG